MKRYEDILHIRKQKPTLNTQQNSQLFTLSVRYVQLDNIIYRDVVNFAKCAANKDWESNEKTIF